MAAAATAQISSFLIGYCSVRDICALSTSKTASAARFPRKLGTAFATGSPLLFQRTFYPVHKSKSLSIRCEQSSKASNGLDVWLGRMAMVGFAAAISVEITTGKGLLENFGLTTPLPTLALVIAASVGVLTAVFIFQSAPEN